MAQRCVSYVLEELKGIDQLDRTLTVKASKINEARWQARWTIVVIAIIMVIMALP